MLKVFFLIIFLLLLILPTSVVARTTPEYIINSKKQAYETRVQNYSSESKQKLENLSRNIVTTNKILSDELDAIMVRQAQILDEYQNRNNGAETDGTADARYWITWAHEAVAYQAAKIYVFDLSRESNLKSDSLNTIAIFQNEMNSTRNKVIKSQNILLRTISK